MKLALATLALVSGASGQTLQDFGFLGGHLYERYDHPINWNDAYALVQDMQPKCGKAPHLVSMDSDEENDFASALIDGTQAWIGTTDQNGWCAAVFDPNDLSLGCEGNWVTLTEVGQHLPLSYSNWAPSEPNNLGNEDCAVTNWGSTLWNDVPCSGYPKDYIIEYDCAPSAYHEG